MRDMNQIESSSVDCNMPPMVMAELPNVPMLLGKAAFKLGRYNVGDPLPALTARVDGLSLDGAHIERYREICGFASDRIPATYMFLTAFPLFMKLLLCKNFPLRAMGQVHLRNQISVHEAIDIGSRLSVSASVGSSELTSRGLEWNIDSIAEVDGQVVWSSQSTFLHRCKTGVDREEKEEIKPLGDPQCWSVNADMGRRYASVSGDFNPIHLTNFTAKMLGFKRAIAHGMWSKARCLAALDKSMPDAGYSVDVRFYRPLFLPSSVSFYSQQLQDKHNFSLFDQSGSQIHLEGSILQD